MAETRVIAGTLRGRKLRTLAGDALRPTAARARSGLFDWLAPRLPGARVLDLFAGTGALGIEALSRGAREGVFVERSARSLAVLHRNLNALDLAASTRVVRGDCARALPRESGHFDVILADPPYAGAARAELLASEALADRVAPGGVLVVERSRRADVLPPPPGLEPGGSRTYGETVFDWYRKSEDSEG